MGRETHAEHGLQERLYLSGGFVAEAALPCPHWDIDCVVQGAGTLSRLLVVLLRAGVLKNEAQEAAAALWTQAVGLHKQASAREDHKHHLTPATSQIYRSLYVQLLRNVHKCAGYLFH